MAEEKANAQTHILQRDIEHLSENFRTHNEQLNTRFISLDKRFDGIAEEQKHQWQEIKEGHQLLTNLRLKVGSLTAYAVIGSVVGSAVVATVIQIAVQRIFN